MKPDLWRDRRSDVIEVAECGRRAVGDDCDEEVCTACCINTCSHEFSRMYLVMFGCQIGNLERSSSLLKTYRKFG
jgi:hypothetical protein